MKLKVSFSVRAVVCVMMFAMRAEAQVQQVRVPIEYRGIRVSVEMPARWANAPFPIRPVPVNPKAEMGGANWYVVWAKDWSWSRSWFRGPLGHMIFDASLRVELPTQAADRKRRDYVRQFNFLKPEELLNYVRAARNGAHRSEFSKYFLIQRGNTIWVRSYKEDDITNGVPSAESWFLGLTEELYVQFDFAAIQDAKDASGERWLDAALYWQNRMIDSIEVSGLKQVTTGRESVISWEFPRTIPEDNTLPR
jgi:hypothetical protein